MYKELTICLAIIIAIVSLNFITRNYTNNSIAKMDDKLNNLKQEVIKEDEDSENNTNELEKANLQEKLNQLENEWENIYSKLTYYLEHNELEKVATRLANIKANVEVQDTQECVSNIEECKYILEHIKEKEQFKIQNIF